MNCVTKIGSVFWQAAHRVGLPSLQRLPARIALAQVQAQHVRHKDDRQRCARQVERGGDAEDARRRQPAKPGAR